MFALRKPSFVSFYSVKTTHFAFLCFFKKHDFELNILSRARFHIEKNKVRQILSLWKIQRVRLSIKNFTACQILNQISKPASDFELNILQRVRSSV